MAKRTKNKSSDALDDAYLEAIQVSNSADLDHAIEQLNVGSKHIETDWGIMDIEVAADAMRVVITALCSRDDSKPVTPKQMLHELKALGIVHGIRTEALIEVANFAKKPVGWQGGIEIAAGTNPKLSAGISYPFLDNFDGEINTSGPIWQIGKQKLSFGALKRAFEIENIKEMAPVLAIAVGPGEVLAVIKKNASKNEGKDVFGNAVENPSQAVLEIGDNVQMGKENTEFVATTFGYLSFLDRKLSVIAPIWISPDQMSAYYVNLPQVGRRVSPKAVDILHSLKELDVKYGIRKKAIDQLCKRLTDNSRVGRAVQIGRGKPAKSGQDAHLQFEMDIEQTPGEILEDGSIDLRERNMVHNIKSEALIATKIEATKGVVGRNLLGESIETTHGKDATFSADSGTRMGKVDRDGEILDAIFAEIDGTVKFKDSAISVDPIFRVIGDVDYEIGNIDFENDVYITGSVKSGFSIKAGGDITINGSIEAGTSIRAKGNLQVGKGILGETTTIVVLGDLRTPFIQNATVIVRGNTWVGSYVHNASVRCGGMIRIHPGGGSRGGSIIGGLVCATKGIEVYRLGSMSTTGTVIALQAEPEASAKLKKLEEAIDFADKNITKMMRTLGLRSADALDIQRLLSSAPPARREMFVKVMAKLNDLMKFKRQTEDEMESLHKAISKVLANGCIAVSKQVYGGVTIQIGEVELPIQEDVSGTTFTLQGNEVVTKNPNMIEEAA